MLLQLLSIFIRAFSKFILLPPDMHTMNITVVCPLFFFLMVDLNKVKYSQNCQVKCFWAFHPTTKYREMCAPHPPTPPPALLPLTGCAVYHGRFMDSFLPTHQQPPHQPSTDTLSHRHLCVYTQRCAEDRFGALA